jgi:hypothetical protein
MKNKIEDLRNHLFETLEALKDKDKPMDIERAKAIAQVADVLVETAKVEVQFIHAVGGKGSGFIPENQVALPGSNGLRKIEGGKS